MRYRGKADMIIRNGTVVDGTGNPPYRADVAVKGDTIVFIGDLAHAGAPLSIDATGRYVTPGFIDEHSHSDSTIWGNPEAQSTIRQGVTTEIVGHCGISEAPMSPEARKAGATGLISVEGLDMPMGSYADAFGKIEAMGIAENMVWLTGHNTLRYLAGISGPDYTEAQFAVMERHLRASLEAGSCGLSTGLEFDPGRQAGPEEIHRLVGIVKEYDAMFTSHIRNRDADVFEAIDEFLDVLRAHRVRGVLSHFNIRSNTGAPENAWHRGVEKMRRARDEEGLDLLTDMTPVEFGIGKMTAILPGWATEGGWRKTCAILADPAMRARLRTDCDRYWRFIHKGEWHRVRLQTSPSFPQFSGLTFPEIARQRGRDEWDCYFDILAEARDQMASCVMLGHLFPEQMVIDGITDPLFMMVVDGFTTLESGPIAEQTRIPLHYMGMMYFFTHYVRELRVMPVEHAVRKVTSLPARHYRLRRRGQIAEGFYADINVFALENLTIKATFERPCVYSEGMDFVIVNGVPVLARGRHTGARPGRTLRP